MGTTRTSWLCKIHNSLVPLIEQDRGLEKLRRLGAGGGGGGGLCSMQGSRHGNSQIGTKIEGLGDADPEVEAQGAHVEEHGQQAQPRHLLAPAEEGEPLLGVVRIGLVGFGGVLPVRPCRVPGFQACMQRG